MPASATASRRRNRPHPTSHQLPSDLLVDDADDALDDFVPAHTDVVGDREVLDRLDDPGAREAVAAQLVEVIDIEAPVQLERLARIVANRFGLSRVRQKPCGRNRRAGPG